MKPRIQCVVTQWIPGSIASGSRPIVMINVRVIVLVSEEGVVGFGGFFVGGAAAQGAVPGVAGG
jgi:hypothetical protein